MSKRSKYTVEEKYKILMDYDNGVGSIQEICIKFFNCEFLPVQKEMMESLNFVLMFEGIV